MVLAQLFDDQTDPLKVTARVQQAFEVADYCTEFELDCSHVESDHWRFWLEADPQPDER